MHPGPPAHQARKTLDSHAPGFVLRLRESNYVCCQGHDKRMRVYVAVASTRIWPLPATALEQTTLLADIIDRPKNNYPISL